MFTIGDRVLLFILAVLTIFSYTIAGGGRQGEEIKVEVRGKSTGAYSLRKSKVIEVNGELGFSKIDIREGKASFVSSPCKNKVCIYQGRIDKNGQMAACIPNKVVIRVLGGEGDYDAVAR